jgi:hypothetical protein
VIHSSQLPQVLLLRASLYFYLDRYYLCLYSSHYILPQVLLLRAPSCVDAVIITLNWSSLYNNNLLIRVDFEVVLVLRYMYLVARRWVGGKQNILHRLIIGLNKDYAMPCTCEESY